MEFLITTNKFLAAIDQKAVSRLLNRRQRNGEIVDRAQKVIEGTEDATIMPTEKSTASNAKNDGEWKQVLSPKKESRSSSKNGVVDGSGGAGRGPRHSNSHSSSPKTGNQNKNVTQKIAPENGGRHAGDVQVAAPPASMTTPVSAFANPPTALVPEKKAWTGKVSSAISGIRTAAVTDKSTEASVSSTPATTTSDARQTCNSTEQLANSTPAPALSATKFAAVVEVAAFIPTTTVPKRTSSKRARSNGARFYFAQH